VVRKALSNKLFIKANMEKKKDILEDVKELDKKVRAKVVYSKLKDIKSWAWDIAALKMKTQLLLEELGVEEADIKRLIDYSTNSQEAQLTKSDIEEIKDEVKEMVDRSKKKIEDKVEEHLPYAMFATTGTLTGGTVWSDWGNNTGTTTGSSYDTTPTFSLK